MARLSLLALATSVLAWPLTARAQDAGSYDSGVRPDSGYVYDSGVRPDSGFVYDSGVRPDSGSVYDSGVIATDGGVVAADGGVTDGGTSGGTTGGGTRPLPIGTYTIQSSAACPATAFPTSSCRLVTVSCPGVAPLGAVLKVTEPTTPAIGTVVLGTGGGGTAAYETFGTTATQNIMTPLRSAGYRIVQRMWQGSNGWMTGPGGGVALGCRYATLIQAIHDQIHTTGPTCVSGNSGGSAEISYALAHYGMGRLVDLAVPTSGPPLARLDYGCMGSTYSTTWASTCQANAVTAYTSCSYGGDAATVDQMYGTTVRDCANHVSTRTTQWLNDSVMSGPAVLAYPQTQVRFVYGGSDSSSAVPLGRIYANAVTSAKTVTIVPNVGHAIPSTLAGANQIYSDLRNGCVLRH